MDEEWMGDVEDEMAGVEEWMGANKLKGLTHLTPAIIN